jgi:hypothetical protein
MRLLQKFAERHARRVAPPNKFAAEAAPPAGMAFGLLA